MAINQIETGYKPEFGLGAMWAGENAANAEMANQLDFIKQFLANQREQQMQPLDVNIRGMESDRATQARSPDMLQAYKDMYLAQRDTTKAAGDKARELSNLDITTGRQDLQHKQAIGSLIAKLDALKAGGDGGQIGFPMQPQQEQPTTNIIGKFSGDPNATLSAINRIPNPTDKQQALQAFKQQYGDISASPVQAANANNSPLVPQPPTRNGGITQGSPEYERIMQALVDQPELRSKLIISDQKLDSSEYGKLLDLRRARERGAGSSGKDPYIEFNKLSPEKRLGIMEWALQGGINPVTRQPLQQEELAQWQALYNQDLATYNAKLQAAQGGKVDIQTTTEGKVPTYPQASAGTTKGTPHKPTVSDTDLINKYLPK
jgi:hypothetical protein